ncbi:MarR family transcriptional regulator [Marinovum sp. 2_MG-2023]|uniref:MarR family winged helix-turn-helix transcriptional regulator n=1 Tax=Roseobacteraceae TaxID=2854170 RepID=UPI001FD62402|nr:MULTISPECIES: MarR family transcriptional regulator [Roseobacteraceae]MCJ7874387.1 MarR family transcriptional regulator [Phaeobacter sp. J2-8]MDO6731196.1 MarR family transcriptional regulator [Marinovum sp. 2_MG-2023]MDO6780652.1 MarR family transcriptional regulator [Marinovum sp. 1_MG-2023]
MTTRANDRTDDSLIALRRILRATELFARDLAHAVGLTPTQLRVLQIVAEKSSTTPKTLANQMGVSQATVTALVDKLVQRALVERIPSEQDRRQINVVATAQGHERLADAPDALQQRYVQAFSRLADWEQAQLVSSLERVADMLDAQDLDASPVLTVGDISTGKSLAKK